MHFAFNADQRALAEAARTLLQDLVPPSTVRAAWHASPGALDRTTWGALADMGVLDACAPESLGGMELDLTWMVLVIEEAGWAGLPDPLVETSLVAAPLLSESLDGRMITTDLGGHAAPCALDADLILVADGDAIRLVDRGSTTIVPIGSLDGARRLAEVHRPAEAGTRIGGADTRAGAWMRGALGTAAMQLGLGRRVLDLAVEHATERRQFGVPIGSFQAVKHQLADVAKELHFTRPAVHRAAWSLATHHRDRERHVAMAKVMAAEAAEAAARAALQVHGAVGYTVEHDLHLFIKRIWTLTPAFGSPAHHRRLIARDLDLSN